MTLQPTTPVQTKVLDFMWSFYLQNDQLPPHRVIKELFDWHSNTVVCDIYAILIRKGYIEKNAVGKHRFTRAYHDVRQPLLAVA